jgi:hypothetical protein
MRCLSRFLFSGWLLFYPPTMGDLGYEKTEFTKLDDPAPGAPLDLWKYERSFDTARECEKWKEDSSSGQMRAALDPTRTPPSLKESRIRLADRLSKGRCVPSESLEFIMKSERQKLKDFEKALEKYLEQRQKK